MFSRKRRLYFFTALLPESFESNDSVTDVSNSAAILRCDIMKRPIILIGYMICITVIVGCSQQGSSSAKNSALSSVFKEEAASGSYNTNVEATNTLAGYVRSEAAFYKWDSNTPDVLYGVIKDDNGFGTKILSKYTQLRNMEYMIIFSGKRPDILFLHQPQEECESIGVSGKIKSIDELNVHSWNELLDHYDIHI